MIVPFTMAKPERVVLYKQIEDHRKHPLLVYVTTKRQGIVTPMASDVVPSIIEQIDALPTDVKQVDFLIASYGGDPMVAWRIMTLLRQRVDKVSILVPQTAYSAATLLAFGGDEIIMHPNGHLGPVDMQITTFHDGTWRQFSTEEITAFLDFVRDNLKITDQEHIRSLFEVICKEVGSLGIGFTVRSSRLAVDLGERLLALHMKDDENRSKLRALVENMSRKFQTHAYPVNLREAKEIGLPIAKSDKELEKLMWSVWLDIESELNERRPFNPVHEVMNSKEGVKLLSPVPQLSLPINAATPGNFTASVQEVVDNSKVMIDPIDFSCKCGLVESSRLSHSFVTSGKILACRTPDLAIHYNVVTIFRGWEKEK
jgi:hypothetical protein